MMQRILPSYDINRLFKEKNKIATELKITENCWICDGWNQVNFYYTPGISDSVVDLNKEE